MYLKICLFILLALLLPPAAPHHRQSRQSQTLLQLCLPVSRSRNQN